MEVHNADSTPERFTIDGDRPPHETIEEVNRLLKKYGLRFDDVEEGSSWHVYVLVHLEEKT